jgi:hypothetical protein
MSDDGSTDERSALAWVMSGTVGAVVVGGLAKHLIDRRRARAIAELDGPGAAEAEEPTAEDPGGLDEAEGHPS